MFHRRNHLALPLAFLMTIAACKDTADPEPEPEIVTMRITIGTGTAQTVNVAKSGCVASNPIVLALNATTAITISFLNAAGQPDAIANDPATFRLAGAATATTVAPEPVPTPSTITWARTGTFAGTLRGTAATTSGTATFSALHVEEGHADFECAVAIIVQ